MWGKGPCVQCVVQDVSEVEGVGGVFEAVIGVRAFGTVFGEEVNKVRGLWLQ